MTEITAVLLDERAGALHSLRCRSGRRTGLGGGSFADAPSHAAQIVVCEPLHRLVHRFDDPKFVAEHEHLNREIKFGLAAEGRHLGITRLAVGAVAGEAGGELPSSMAAFDEVTPKIRRAASIDANERVRRVAQALKQASSRERVWKISVSL